MNIGLRLVFTTAPAKGKKLESEWNQKWQPQEALLLGENQINRILGNDKEEERRNKQLKRNETCRPFLSASPTIIH